MEFAISLQNAGAEAFYTRSQRRYIHLDRRFQNGILQPGEKYQPAVTYSIIAMLKGVTQLAISGGCLFVALDLSMVLVV